MNPGLVGYLIGLAFAVYWLRVGSIAVGQPYGVIIFVCGSIAMLAALWRIWTNRNQAVPGARFHLGWYLLALGGEIVAFNVALLVLPPDFLATYQAPVIGAIVGLHFIGVWLATDMRRFLYLSGVMTAINLVALLLPVGHGPAILAGLGSAAVLAATVAA